MNLLYKEIFYRILVIILAIISSIIIISTVIYLRNLANNSLNLDVRTLGSAVTQFDLTNFEKIHSRFAQ